jgi:hypothetical protein
MHGVLWALHNAQEALRNPHVKPDAIPKLPTEAVRILEFFSGYARRAASELARYGLETADGSPHERG